MKNSNIEWIGDIPNCWSIKPNKYVMHKEKDICVSYNNENVLSLSMYGVNIKDLSNPSGKMPTSFDGYQYVKKGNLLMCLFDIDVTPRCIGFINDDGVTSPAYSQFVVKDGIFAKYFYYYYLMMDYKKELLHFAKNIRHSLTEDQFGEIPVCVPPYNEQVRISNYLDEKISEIDELLDVERQTIDVLEKYKLRMMDETINKNVVEKTKLKYLCSYFSSNIAVKDLSQNNSLYPVYGAAGIMGYSKSFELEKSYIGIVKDGAGVGRVKIYPPKSSLLGTMGYIIPNDDVDIEWLLECITAMNLGQSIDCTTIPHIYFSDYGNRFVKKTSIEEQKNVYKSIGWKKEKINEMLDIHKEKIKELESFKRSLVYECVTGKKSLL